MSASEIPPARPELDQIAVTLEYLQLLTSKLDDLGIEHALESESEDLGLALVSIAHAEIGAKNALLAVGELDVATTGQGEDQAGGGHDQREWPTRPSSGRPLDTILWSLRRLFKAEFSGWSPSMGKNRVVDHVHGVWEVIHSGDPNAPRELDKEPERVTRAQGPGTGVRVGVLDTGLYPQPWLAGGWVARYTDLLSPGSVPTMAQGHATFIAGLVLQQAPGAVVVVRQVLDQDGSTDSWTAAEEIVRLGRSGVDIINLSFACYTDDNEPPFVLATAVDRLDPNIVVVAAAGNSEQRDAAGNIVRESNRPAWPAALDDVVAVGATDNDGEPATFSPTAPWVDLLARGVDLISTYPDEVRISTAGGTARGTGETTPPTEYKGGWAKWQGTSFAAALIAGAIAAGTAPGRVSAAAAARDLFPRHALKSGAHRGYRPAFVPLRTW